MRDGCKNVILRQNLVDLRFDIPPALPRGRALRISRTFVQGCLISLVLLLVLIRVDTVDLLLDERLHLFEEFVFPAYLFLQGNSFFELVPHLDFHLFDSGEDLRFELL